MMKQAFMKVQLGTILLLLYSFAISGDVKDSIPGVRKIKDVMIYHDTSFYSTFPSIIKKRDGELLLAFRRAPNRQIFGEKSNKHVDDNSYIVMLRSKDGEVWPKKTELIYAHPFGGSQDPCLLQMKNGTILCSSYGWQAVRPEGMPNLRKPILETEGYVFLGGYLIRSPDGGKTWSDAIYPPAIAPEINYNALGQKVPAYNRGAMYEAKDGRILWIVAAFDSTRKTSNYLLTSRDNGLTWKYRGEVAKDSKVLFNEASIYETPQGDIIGFLRTANFEDQAVIARSKDGGKTFKWESMGFQGHPLNALRLPDNRVLLTYGYRHKPYGIRARILNAECTDFKTAPEIILRDDGDNGDLGYTWSVQLNKNRVLIVYYFNKKNSIRYIAGTILEIK